MNMVGVAIFWTTSCILLLHSSLVESNDYIHITCTSCDDPTAKQFVGSLGSDLVIRYTINETTLHLFKLYYNAPNNTNEIWWAEKLIKVINVTDTRLTWNEISEKNPHILEVTLKGLTQADDGGVFRFDGRDDGLVPAYGENSVKVTPAKKKAETSEPVDSDVIVIGIVIGVIIVVMLILMLLLYKGFITLDGCLVLCGFGKKNVDESKKPFQWEETDEKVYDAPKNQMGLYSGAPQQTEYAALGPGGGRVDKPKDKPQKSAYAQVKTEDVDYPPMSEEYADSIIV